MNRLHCLFSTIVCAAVVLLLSLSRGTAQERAQEAEDEIRRPLHTRLEFSHDGSKLITIGNAIRVIDVDNGKVIKSWPLKPNVFVSRADFIPGKKPRYVAGTQNGEIIVWSDSWDKPERKLEKQEDIFTDLSVSPDGSQLVSSYFSYLEGKPKSATVALWSLKSGELLHKSTVDGHAIYTVRFSPDGRSVAYSIDDLNEGASTLAIRNAASWNVEESIAFLPGFSQRLVWSENGKRIVIAGGECVPTGRGGCLAKGRLWLAERGSNEPAKLIDSNPNDYYRDADGVGAGDRFVVISQLLKQDFDGAGQLFRRSVGTVEIRDFKSGEIKSTIQLEESTDLFGVACWKAGNLIAACDVSDKIHLIDYKTEEPIEPIMLKED